MDEQFASAATNVSISREIRFGNAVSQIEERANALDQIKAHLLNGGAAKPFAKHAPLERRRHFAKRFHRQRCRFESFRQQAFKKVLLFSRNGRGSPNVLPNISPERFLQIRNDTVTDAVSKRSEIPV